MTSLAVIEAKISLIRKYLKILRGYQNYSESTIRQDITLKAAPGRYRIFPAPGKKEIGPLNGKEMRAMACFMRLNRT